MSKDSFPVQKTRKYIHSIPSRENILNHLTKRKKPASYEELIFELCINGKEQTKAFRRCLKSMERNGQLVFIRRQYYATLTCLNLLKGTIIGHRDGYGFLRVEDSKEDFYLSPEQMKNYIHGDQVLAQPFGSDKKNRREARIIRMLVPKSSQIVGRYFNNDAGIGFVIPNDSRLNFNIFISQEDMMNVRIGFIVVVKLIKRPTRNNKAIGKIIEILGDNMDTDMAIDIALRTHEIPYIWPKKVEEQIKKIREEISEDSKTKRVDLRHLPLITIDDEDARDFDDAVYCEKRKMGGWRLWVAIADVSYYVRPYTPLDKEARSRGTSIYFPLQVVPMLPEILSNNLCSLKPQVDRLCIVCEMTISPIGRLTYYNFYEAIMHSHARLTYNKVWNILQGNQELRKQYTSLVKHIEELYNLYKILDQAREERGGISFEIKEAKFIFNSDRRIERIEQKQRNDAHKLIEECMILANVAAARFVEKEKEPALFRVHEKPSVESVTAFRSILSELSLKLPGFRGNKLESRDYAKILESIANRPDHEMLQTMFLRSMKQAIYNPKNIGHFGLALHSYAHFTSSIRRYSDLSLHRTIKYLLALKKGEIVKGQCTITGGWCYSMEEISELGKHCSMVERRADETTREVEDWLKCDFMLDQIGKTFNGMISGVTGFGFFVRINTLFVDGLVHVSTLNNDYYRFDQIGQRLVGESGGFIYQLGDYVKVRVEAVNIDERRIDFSLISSERLQRNIGKTIREKRKCINKRYQIRAR